MFHQSITELIASTLAISDLIYQWLSMTMISIVFKIKLFIMLSYNIKLGNQISNINQTVFSFPNKELRFSCKYKFTAHKV